MILSEPRFFYRQIVYQTSFMRSSLDNPTTVI